ncbi:peptidoglycan DD-metalloendopeptidase family protein [Spartinivicinus poritis]|uniref:Peptidoglycan DD-metalloendopeptidase family protein n=1 Tax=Spartinivicinus poritis TaxID=2994640 RepID=A0ABT5U4L0_9GAMM|nr:peptidoglycan DD-metalloendopeptidase family protein [Spartinivicinus sp. A2-2]MDE1461299.1 peptidoglycan DD-metalloendopeptidase family protein [Spartinivicinus sp. A2-2]
MIRFIWLFFFASLSLNAGEIYKYKDENGKWIFTDKKPASNKGEKIEYKNDNKKRVRPRVFVKNIDGVNQLIVKNPFYAPIEIEIYSSIFDQNRLHKVLPEKSTTVVYSSQQNIPRYRYRWLMGDPAAQEINYNYLFPVLSKSKHQVTQSFNGRFSHYQAPNKYAVDIAMPVGTYIRAAREGVVVQVKEDYHMSGTSGYFLDKANYVKVLHSDGTYAVYAHILLGTSLVKAGDKVSAGDKLARSGSSGFSTGPHLHFVIRKNAGRKLVSVPFVFIDNNGKTFTPRRGQKIKGI